MDNSNDRSIKKILSWLDIDASLTTGDLVQLKKFQSVDPKAFDKMIKGASKEGYSHILGKAAKDTEYWEDIRSEYGSKKES